MAVDFHAHWIPPSLAALLRTRRTAPRIAQENGTERLITFLGSRPFGPGLSDLEARRELMARCGITMQVLSLAGLFGMDCLPVEESLPLVTAFNDAAAKVVRADPRRFAAVAALPLADVALACRELERSHGVGLRGAILPADGLANRGAAERFLPLLETGNRLRSHFFVHPGALEPQLELNLRKVTADNAWQRHVTLETQARLSEVIVTLELSDYLDPFPSVTVQIANLGGTIPFLVERMDQVSTEMLSGKAWRSARHRRCYVDTASFGPRAIELAVECFGADRVVLGTDCPIFDAGRMLESIAAAARLDSRCRELVLWGNAQALLGLQLNGPAASRFNVS